MCVEVACSWRGIGHLHFVLLVLSLEIIILLQGEGRVVLVPTATTLRKPLAAEHGMKDKDPDHHHHTPPAREVCGLVWL